MRFFKLLLFYYSLIAVTALLAVSFFLLPSPQNIANTLVLTPVAFLLWVYATNPNQITASTWSIRFVIAIALVGSLAVFAYFLSVRYLPKSAPIVDPALSDIRSSFSESQRKNDEFQEFLRGEVEYIKNEIEVLKEIQGGNTLGSASEILLEEDFAIVLGKVSTKGTSSVQVYKDANLNSETLGTLKANQEYSYFDKKNNFFQVKGFDSENPDTFGWVQDWLVVEN